ncbi:polysaccharide pyruvyl transferase family protein, partial [Blautia sp. HCP3S3_D9]|uniref:polysaccharide pyruvyl transferase family protein n=1 Tax=Blautia sp. HCP3S3_D9 TaxID=3438912 RepID=UPI003F8C9DE5
MKKIAILTIFNNNNNYGGVLQAYALQYVLRKKGYIADVVVYINGKNPIYKSVGSQLKQYKINEIVHKVLAKVEGKVFSKKIINILEDREYLFNNFRENYINKSEPYDDNTLRDSQRIYDAYICGSDQIWNPNAARNGFLLSMIDEKHYKIAYAASIGRSVLTEYEKSIMIPLIKRFDFVSVREKTAQAILSNSGVEDVNVVLDPTLLIDKVEWEALCNKELAKEKYVLCYFFSDSREYRKKIEKYCKLYNLKLYY